MATPKEALALLLADPGTFLRHYYVKCERKTGQNGIVDYLFQALGSITASGKEEFNRTLRPGSILGNLNKHASKNFKFSPAAQKIVPGGIGEIAKTSAWHVDVFPSNNIDLSEIPNCEVLRKGGPSLMLTTLLNGCTFVCQPEKDLVRMTHIQPRATSGKDLEVALSKTGKLKGTSVSSLVSFGANSGYRSDSEDVTIIGVRTGAGNWRVFAQTHPASRNENVKISEIFNG